MSRGDAAKKLSDQEAVQVLEALMERARHVDGDAPRRERMAYRALSQAVADIKARMDTSRALDAEAFLSQALRGMENGKLDGEDFTPGSLRDVAIKTRKYFPLISEALRKFGFRCAARAGSTGANDPQDCGWPSCGCDPYAVMVLDRYIKQNGTEIEPGVESLAVGGDGP